MTHPFGQEWLDRVRATLHSMQLYAITADRGQIFTQVQEWTGGGVQFIQLRAKDLDAAELTTLARDIKARIDPKRTRLLINLPSPSLATIALAAGADGVHLAGPPIPGSLDAVRRAFRTAGRDVIVSLPCHSHNEVELAREEKADLILFSPVFEKFSAVPQGLEALRQACAIAPGVPVFALGGVTAANAAACQAAGAAGVAGIRLFAEGNWRRLRSLPAL